jgi:hypothetical protein
MKKEFNIFVLTLLLGVMVPLTNGCAIFLPDCCFPDVNVAYYEVTVPAAKQPEFREEFNELARELEAELGWKYVPETKFGNGPDLFNGYFEQNTCRVVFIEGDARYGAISVGWNGLPPSNPEYQKIRDHFEKVLNKKYPSHWKFYFQKKSYLLV